MQFSHTGATFDTKPILKGFLTPTVRPTYAARHFLKLSVIDSDVVSDRGVYYTISGSQIKPALRFLCALWQEL